MAVPLMFIHNHLDLFNNSNILVTINNIKFTQDILWILSSNSHSIQVLTLLTISNPLILTLSVKLLNTRLGHLI